MPAGTSATINWGTTGTGALTSTFPIGTSNPLANLYSFPGQQNLNGITPLSHYNTPGSYNMLYMVTLPSGCVYSYYCIMSYGGGAISLGTTTAQTQCSPLNYVLNFINQTPGNTYLIDWEMEHPPVLILIQTFRFFQMVFLTPICQVLVLVPCHNFMK